MFKVTMRNDRTFRASRVRDERGVTTVEYVIMLFLVALAVAAFGDVMSGTVTGVFDQLVEALT